MASGHAKFEFTSKPWKHSNRSKVKSFRSMIIDDASKTCFDRYYSKLDKKLKEEGEEKVFLLRKK